MGLVWRRLLQAGNQQLFSRLGYSRPSAVFTRRAREIPCCQFCLLDSHTTQCAPEDFRQYWNRQPSPRHGAARTPVVQICCLFNQLGGSQCCFKQCRYSHLGATATPGVLSATGASPAVLGQLCLRARRGRHSSHRAPPSHMFVWDTAVVRSDPDDVETGVGELVLCGRWGAWAWRIAIRQSIYVSCSGVKGGMSLGVGTVSCSCEFMA